MSYIQRRELPKPFGDSLPTSASRQAFQRIIKLAPDLQIYDGAHDYDTRILKYAESKKKVQGLIVDDTVPPLPEDLIQAKRPFLGRAQYFQEGLHHRISFYFVVVKQGQYEDYPALWLQIVPPIKRVSNLYVSVVQDNRPVYLEIPVQGAPPQVRVMEMSMEKLKVFSENTAKLFPTQQYLKGVKVQLVDVGEASVAGTVKQTGEQEAELEIEKMSKKSRKTINEYMEEEFREAHNPEKSSEPSTAKPSRDPAESKGAVRSEEPSVAVILLEDAKLNEAYTQALKELGFTCLNPSSVLDLKKEHLDDVALMVLDAEVEGHHAVEWLGVWVEKQWMLPGRFVIVAENAEDFRRDQWRPLGKGLALRTNYPEQWIGQRLREWLGIKQTKEMTETPDVRREKLVLVADDEPDMLDITSSLLIEHGFKVVTAMNGREVVREAKNRKPDLILLDLKMPEYDGLQALNTIRSFSLTKETPVIIISGYYGPEHVHEAYHLGVAKFISKPYKPKQLMEVIEDVFALAEDSNQSLLKKLREQRGEETD